MARTGKPKTPRTGVLARLDAVCTALAVHVDALTTLANKRDDGAITRLALAADLTCRRLHAVYADLATGESEEVATW